MSAWIAFRIVKFAALGVFVTGLSRSIFARSQTERLHGSHWTTPLGLLGVWAAGYALMKLTGRSLGEPWILQSMGASAIAVVGAFAAARSPRTTVAAAFAVGAGLLASVGLMVARELSSALAMLAIPAAGGLATAFAARRRTMPEPAPDRDQQTLVWFAWVARAEGVSLILLVLVAMPIRAATGVSLDGGTGLLGWVHGVLVLFFIPAAVLARRAGQWPASRVVLAVVASLVPGGTFVFERRYIAARVSA